MSDFTRKLPSEVLAECLRFLEFRDVIAASHVSSFWRSSAITFPDLWSRIFIDTMLWKSPDLLHTAMSRARLHPVDLEFVAPGPVTEGMAEAIAEHMNHLVSLKWTYSIQGVDTSRPAPLLRELSCEEVRFRVPKNFLNGSRGSLRTLLLGETIFPSSCPALATVTYLRATYPEYYDEDAGFAYIFKLCPCLETLHLHELADNTGIGNPTRPPPRTLREVFLQSFTSYNLVQLYTAWALDSVPSVQLCMPIDIKVNFAAFLGLALSLSVAFECEDAEAHIVAQLPDARTRTVVCGELTNVRSPISAVAKILPYAPDLRALAVPLGLLGRAVRSRHQRWPRLAHLSVHVHEGQVFSKSPVTGHPRFRCAALDCLRALPALNTLELHFHATDPPTLDDARELKECLVSLHDCVPRDVHVYGFPLEVVRETIVHDDDRPRLVLH